MLQNTLFKRETYNIMERRTTKKEEARKRLVEALQDNNRVVIGDIFRYLFSDEILEEAVFVFIISYICFRCLRITPAGKLSLSFDLMEQDARYVFYIVEQIAAQIAKIIIEFFYNGVI